MGLLTSDSSHNNKLTKLLTEQSVKLSILSYLLAIVVIIYLINEPDRTYFSDNALLPGLVDREFTLDDFATQTLKSLRDEASNSLDKIPYGFLFNQFRQFGLEVYTHNFTLNYPFGAKKKIQGTNVYAILRSARAPSTEAIVLSTPFRNDDNPHGTTLPGIALMIAMAKYFSVKTYWAKDIVFVISDHELIGMQAWLDAYHDFRRYENPVLEYGILPSRSGPIQAAVNLEIHSDKTSRVDIKIEGLNGQLPNLDLFNVAVELCTRESITATFHSQAHPIDRDRFELWKQYALTIGSMMISQGITLPTGAHGLFQRFAIQAITLEAPEMTSKNDYLLVTFKHMGRLIEGIFRSLNNLLEKFNRSYYFYLLPSTRRYISIGYYMIPFGLLTLPLILNALNLYLKEKTSEHSGDSLWNSLPFCFICHLHGLLLLLIPYLIERFSHFIPNYLADDIIYYSIVTLSLLYLINPFTKTRTKTLTSRRCIALLNLALVFCCLSLVNISLAFSLSFIYVPIACFSRKTCVRLYKCINFILVILLHPLMIMFICLLVLSISYDFKESFLTHLLRAFQAQKKSILYYIEDWYIFGNWTYFFGCVFLFPAWLQIWHNI